jgi:hypothetical protein
VIATHIGWCNNMASSCGSDMDEKIVELDCTWLIVILHEYIEILADSKRHDN